MNFLNWKILEFPHCVSGLLQMGQTPAWKWCSREGLDEIIFILSLALTDKVTEKLSWCYCSWEMPSLHFSVSSSSQFWNVVSFRARSIFRNFSEVNHYFWGKLRLLSVTKWTWWNLEFLSHFANFSNFFFRIEQILNWNLSNFSNFFSLFESIVSLFFKSNEFQTNSSLTPHLMWAQSKIDINGLWNLHSELCNES